MLSFILMVTFVLGKGHWSYSNYIAMGYFLSYFKNIYFPPACTPDLHSSSQSTTILLGEISIFLKRPKMKYLHHLTWKLIAWEWIFKILLISSLSLSHHYNINSQSWWAQWAGFITTLWQTHCHMLTTPVSDRSWTPRKMLLPISRHRSGSGEGLAWWSLLGMAPKPLHSSKCNHVKRTQWRTWIV